MKSQDWACFGGPTLLTLLVSRTLQCSTALIALSQHWNLWLGSILKQPLAPQFGAASFFQSLYLPPIPTLFCWSPTLFCFTCLVYSFHLFSPPLYFGGFSTDLCRSAMPCYPKRQRLPSKNGNRSLYAKLSLRADVKSCKVCKFHQWSFPSCSIEPHLFKPCLVRSCAHSRSYCHQRLPPPTQEWVLSELSEPPFVWKIHVECNSVVEHREHHKNRGIWRTLLSMSLYFVLVMCLDHQVQQWCWHSLILLISDHCEKRTENQYLWIHGIILISCKNVQ